MEKERIQKRIEYWKTRRIEAVINSSPSIYLAKVGGLDLLDIYSKVYMPQIVKKEVVDSGKRVSAPDALFLENAIEEGRIVPDAPNSKRVYNTIIKNPLIQKADAQAIALAHEKKAVLIMDDSKGIEVARMLNIEVEPTLTVVFIAHALGISGYSRAKEIYKTLLSTTFRISALEYEKALKHLDMLREILG
jgi:predicted nucleic acid-binding protein